MTRSLGPDGRFWPCNEDLHWCFPCMGFLGYIVCLYVVTCDNVYFSLILLFNVARFNLTPYSGWLK